jgi:hypothetical protein
MNLINYNRKKDKAEFNFSKDKISNKYAKSVIALFVSCFFIGLL